MKKAIMITAGFLLVGLGLLSLMLMLLGGRFTYLRWLDYWGPLAGFVLKLLMVLAGFLLIFLSGIDWEKERDALK